MGGIESTFACCGPLERKESGGSAPTPQAQAKSNSAATPKAAISAQPKSADVPSATPKPPPQPIAPSDAKKPEATTPKEGAPTKWDVNAKEFVPKAATNIAIAAALDPPATTTKKSRKGKKKEQAVTGTSSFNANAPEFVPVAMNPAMMAAYSNSFAAVNSIPATTTHSTGSMNMAFSNSRKSMLSRRSDKTIKGPVPEALKELKMAPRPDA